MNTLVNDSLPGEEAPSPSEEVTFDTIPEAVSSQTGVSVRYVESPEKKWYVFRASYGRDIKAADKLIEANVYAYVPQQYTILERDGIRKKVLRSLLPNIVFAYLDTAHANLFVKGPSARRGGSPSAITADDLTEEELSRVFYLNSILSFYYNHFAQDEQGKNPPLTVPRQDMRDFICVTKTHNIHLKTVIPEKARYLINQTVEIIKGDYQGVRGRIARIGGQQCLVVSIANGEFQIATEYIPTPFLRVIDDPS